MVYWNNRGQFYLIAAIVIIAIIIGFAAVSNSARKLDQTRVYDLGEELGIEGEQVLDYGLVTNDFKIEDFTSRFADYAEEEKTNILFIFGDDQGKIRVRTYEELVVGSIGIGTTKTNITRTGRVDEIIDPDLLEDDIVTIKFGETNYDFELKPDQTFYFIIYKKGEGEDYVSRR